MAKMTRKQVKEFLNNDENWTIIPGNLYVRLETLDYQDLHYAAIAHKHVANAYRLYRSDEEPIVEFHRFSYHILDREHQALGYSVSMTEMENKIFERSRK